MEKENILKLLKDFENMGNIAKAKAYSKLSLERPLTNEEYEQFMEVGKKLGYNETIKKKEEGRE